MSSSSFESLPKDRKKSAHWSESDTAILIEYLLQHKDSSRTNDNGFKIEVWKEVSHLLEGTTVTGGPKTPEACKSRWQRVRDSFSSSWNVTDGNHTASARLQGCQRDGSSFGLHVGSLVSQAQSLACRLGRGRKGDFCFSFACKFGRA